MALPMLQYFADWRATVDAHASAVDVPYVALVVRNDGGAAADYGAANAI